MTRVFFADQLCGSGVQILLGIPDALPKSRRDRLVQNPDAGAGSFVDLNAVKTRVFVTTAGADGPDLAGFKRISTDAVAALQFGCGTNFSIPFVPIT